MSRLKPNFTHRLDPDDDLTESINAMTNRLLGMLESLSVQFEGDVGRMSDEMIHCLIDVAINEAKDIKSISQAHSQADYTQQQEKLALVK